MPSQGRKAVRPRASTLLVILRRWNSTASTLVWRARAIWWLSRPWRTRCNTAHSIGVSVSGYVGRPRRLNGFGRRPSYPLEGGFPLPY